MKKLFTITLALFVIVQSAAQNTELAFTAVVDQSHIQLDSIKIMNRNEGCDTLIVFPDTVLSITIAAVNPYMSDISTMSLSRNYPNPFTDHTSFSVFLPDKDDLYLRVHTLLGQKAAEYHSHLDPGTHHFTFYPAQENWYIVTASTPKGSQSLKMSCLGSGSQQGRIVQTDGMDFKPATKAAPLDDYFKYSFGDNLLFVGYANSFAGVLEAGILGAPVENTTYTFQFATNIPCPEIPTVNYEGQVYNTIQIFSQCWLKENLNVGTMVPGEQEMDDNSTIEKYCFNNEEDSCNVYGGLYQWNEMMQYINQLGTQGICPAGWHIPTDEEWKILEGTVDSQFGIGDPEWDGWDGWKGYDAGVNLKSSVGWLGGGNGSNLYNFSGIPGGTRNGDGVFLHIGSRGIWWASSKNDSFKAYLRYLNSSTSTVSHYPDYKVRGFSVRCIKD